MKSRETGVRNRGYFNALLIYGGKGNEDNQWNEILGAAPAPANLLVIFSFSKG